MLYKIHCTIDNYGYMFLTLVKIFRTTWRALALSALSYPKSFWCLCIFEVKRDVYDKNQWPMCSSQ